jgi:hypothetical protein
MKRLTAGWLALTVLAVLGQTGCATREQWQTWKSHNTHFASGQHMGFSLRNQGAQAEQVRPTDPTKAQQESWWGRKLPMAPGQGGGS